MTDRSKTPPEAFSLLKGCNVLFPYASAFSRPAALPEDLLNGLLSWGNR